MLSKLIKDLQKLKSPQRAKVSAWFFKTGPGQYGEGDVFFGIKVPAMHTVSKKYLYLSLLDLKKLLSDKIHEYRSVALFILVEKYKKAINLGKKEIYDFYLKNTKYVNNWDLVDSSAEYIVGDFIRRQDKSILVKLAKSANLWEKRIAIVATYAFIKNREFGWTLKIAEILLSDKHDLIHKAVGWMLREVGKRDLKAEEKFLKKYYKIMPRTMLRYAIERFKEDKRKFYMAKI